MSEVPKRENLEKGERTWQEAAENRDEIFTSGQIFELILANEYPNLDPENRKKELLERGLKEEDIDTALMFMACVGLVNRAIFRQSGIPLELIPSTNKKDPDIYAGYCPADKNPEESYCVWVENFSNYIERDTQKKMILVGEDGKPLKEKVFPTKAEILLTMAIHEVRHRLQHQKDFRLFSVEDFRREENPILKWFIKFTKRLHEEKEKIYRLEKRSEEFISDRMSQREFDSDVAEYFAGNQIQKGITLEEFFRLTMIHPPEK